MPVDVFAASDQSVLMDKKWLVFFAISLSANVLFIALSDVKGDISHRSTTISLFSVSLLPALSAPQESALSTQLSPVLKTQDNTLPENIITQSAGESIQKLSVTENTERGESASHIASVGKNRPQENDQQINKVSETQELSTLVEGRVIALNEDVSESKAAPENTNATQQLISKNGVSTTSVNSPEHELSSQVAIEGGAPGDQFNLGSGGVYSEAQYLQRQAPRYPARARTLGQQGTVVLHAEVLPSGYSQHLEVAVSSGYQLLDGAALAAVRNWQFVPAYAQGHPVAHWVSVPVRFTLQ